MKNGTARSRLAELLNWGLLRRAGFRPVGPTESGSAKPDTAGGGLGGENGRRQTPVQRQALAARLHDLSRAFSRDSQRTETDFMQLGRALRALYAAATELATLVHAKAATLSRVLAESKLGGTDGLAARKLSELRRGLEETAELLESLRTLERAVARLQGQVKGLERVGAFLSASVFSFAIESVRTPTCQEAFGTFVGEMRELANRIARLEESIGDQVQATRTAHAQGLEAMAAGLKGMKGLAGELEQSARATVAEAQGLLDQAQAVLAQAQARSSQIGRQADEAVYYLQFGDILRQKLEHVGAALAEGAELLGRRGSEAEWDAWAMAAEAVVGIQRRQLELIQQEVGAAQSRLESCFEGINEESRSLAAALGQWRLTTGTEAAGASPLAVLANDAQRVEVLHAEGQSLQAGARAKAQQAAEALARLAQHLSQVTAINRDMHLQALNAIIKTARLGAQGATLEVLSMNVDSLFRESNQEVTDIVTTVQTIVQQAHSTAEASGNTADQAVASPEGAGDLAGGLRRVSEACADFDQTATAATSLAERQQEALADSQAGLAFLAEFGSALTEQLGELAALQAELAPWKGTGAAPAAATLAALGLQYTMQSEREVHEQAGLPAASSTPATGELELFDEPTSPTPSLSAEAAPALASERVPPKPEGDRAAGSELGDNIEFF